MGGASTEGGAADLLAPILERKRRECARRRAHLALFDPHRPADAPGADGERAAAAVRALRRGPGEPPRVVAEVKFRSPSAGEIRRWAAGEGRRVARAYERAGASAISVLCDRAGFGGSPLELRRVAGAVSVPLLFKEFVLDPIQVELARRVGASMVLLLVRAMGDEALRAMVAACRAAGLAPVVEAADEAEMERALATGARIVGINARDLSTFRVDPARAARAVRNVPESRVAVYMSGVSSPDELARVAATRADAVLVGSGLMRAPDPGRRLAELLEAHA